MGNRVSTAGLSAHRALDASQLMAAATGGEAVVVLFYYFQILVLSGVLGLV
jgi:hypothetical protein